MIVILYLKLLKGCVITLMTREKTDKRAVVFKIISIILIIFIVASSIFTKYIELNNAMYYDFGKDVAMGIDVSEHNKEIDWNEVKRSVDFAFIRVGYRGYGTGKIVEDKYARVNMEGAKKAGVPFGVYFYSQAVNRTEAREEAKFVLSKIKKYNPELPVVIDFEYPTDDEGNRIGRLSEASLTSEKNTEVINAFCNTVEKARYSSGVYASSSVFAWNIDVDDISSSTAIWVADYNEEISHNVKYNIWQYSRTGKVNGVGSKNVDLNYWYKRGNIRNEKIK